MNFCLYCTAETEGKFCPGSICRNAFYSADRKVLDMVAYVRSTPGALKALADWFEQTRQDIAQTPLTAPERPGE